MVYYVKIVSVKSTIVYFVYVELNRITKVNFLQSMTSLNSYLKEYEWEILLMLATHRLIIPSLTLTLKKDCDLKSMKDKKNISNNARRNLQQPFIILQTFVITFCKLTQQKVQCKTFKELLRLRKELYFNYFVLL